MASEIINEDALAESLADAAIALVVESYPSASPKFRRRLARLYLHQLTGSEKPPGRISEAAIAKHLGISRQRAHETKHIALAKLHIALRDRHPELFP